MIRGSIVVLRAIEEPDLKQLLSWRNTPHLRRYFREHKEINSIQQKAWFERISKHDSNHLMFAIIDKKNELIGAGGLCYVNHIHKTAEISLYIGKNNLYIDDNLARDAALTIITYGFNEVGLNRIWTEVYSFDKPKQKLLKTLCFQHEGTLRQAYWVNGSWQDSFVYGLLKTEFYGKQ